MKTHLSHALFVSVLTGLSAPASAAVIDLFTSSPQEWVASEPVGNTPVSTAPVPLTDSLFENRTLSFFDGAQQVSILNGALRYQTLEATAPGSLFEENGYLTVSYTAASPINLLKGGDTAFAIDFQDFTGPPPYLFGVGIIVPGLSGYSLISVPEFETSASFPTRVIIPFSRFSGTDLSAVQAVLLDAGRLRPGTSFTLTGFSTVPEPSTTALFTTLGACSCTFRRRPGTKTA